MVGDATEISTFGADTEHSAASYIIKRDWSCVYMNPIWSRTITVLQMVEFTIICVKIHISRKTLFWEKLFLIKTI